MFFYPEWRRRAASSIKSNGETAARTGGTLINLAITREALVVTTACSHAWNG